MHICLSHKKQSTLERQLIIEEVIKIFTHEQKVFEKYLERIFTDHNEDIIRTIIYCNSNPDKMHHEERRAYESLTSREVNQVVNEITLPF